MSALSKAFVNSAPMLDRIKRDDTARVINPKQDSVISHSIFVKRLKASREIAERLGDQFRVPGKPLQLLFDTLCDGCVEFGERALEGRSRG